jgi:hypothetical protein
MGQVCVHVLRFSPLTIIPPIFHIPSLIAHKRYTSVGIDSVFIEHDLIHVNQGSCGSTTRSRCCTIGPWNRPFGTQVAGQQKPSSVLCNIRDTSHRPLTFSSIWVLLREEISEITKKKKKKHFSKLVSIQPAQLRADSVFCYLPEEQWCRSSPARNKQICHAIKFALIRPLPTVTQSALRSIIHCLMSGQFVFFLGGGGAEIRPSRPSVLCSGFVTSLESYLGSSHD